MIVDPIIEIDFDICIMCMCCTEVCPTGALEKFPDLPNFKGITYIVEKCIRCKECKEACPVGAIRLIPEDC